MVVLMIQALERQDLEVQKRELRRPREGVDSLTNSIHETFILVFYPT